MTKEEVYKAALDNLMNTKGFIITKNPEIVLGRMGFSFSNFDVEFAKAVKAYATENNLVVTELPSELIRLNRKEN